MNETAILRFPTDELRAHLALAETAMRYGQTPQAWAKAMRDIENIKAELARRGEKVAA